MFCRRCSAARPGVAAPAALGCAEAEAEAEAVAVGGCNTRGGITRKLEAEAEAEVEVEVEVVGGGLLAAEAAEAEV